MSELLVKVERLRGGVRLPKHILPRGHRWRQFPTNLIENRQALTKRVRKRELAGWHLSCWHCPVQA